jgi:hypothetical protein
MDSQCQSKTSGTPGGGFELFAYPPALHEVIDFSCFVLAANSRALSEHNMF